MEQEETSIEALRERLTETLAEWGTEMSAVLLELETKRAALAQVQARQEAQGEEFDALKSEIDAQKELIENLRREAEQASGLRGELDAKTAELEAKTAEIESLSSELQSKRELIRALRRETQLRVDALEAENRSLREAEQERTYGDATELAAVRAELEARKTLIKSLRADADRVDALEERLEEKREIIGTLEASINQHADKIAELKRAADLWKRKYRELKGTTTTTSASFAGWPEIEPETSEPPAGGDASPSQRTIAIDMRESLLEARRRSNEGRKKD